MTTWTVPREIFVTESPYSCTYSWDEFHVYRNARPVGESYVYFANSQSGCSCDMYEEPDWPNFNNWDTRTMVIKAFEAWSAGIDPFIKAGMREKLLEALNQNR